MNELLEGVNWTAVIVGFVVAYLLGMVWYNPKVFGTKWAEAVGMKQDGDMPIAAMSIQALGTFLLSWLVGITAAASELLTIILIAITIIVLMSAGSMYVQKPGKAIFIEGSYVFAMLVVMIVCQGLF